MAQKTTDSGVKTDGPGLHGAAGTLVTVACRGGSPSGGLSARNAMLTTLAALLGFALAAVIALGIGAIWSGSRTGSGNWTWSGSGRGRGNGAGARETVSSFTGLSGRLLPEASGAIREVVMHYVPTSVPMVEPAYADFLRSIAPDVRVQLVLARGMTESDRSELQQFLHRIDPTEALARRVSLVEVEGPITTWSKDRALVAGAPNGAAPAIGTSSIGVAAAPSATGPRTLVAPIDPGTLWVQRHNDWATVAAIARAAPARYSATILPLEFDAGDFAVDDRRVIVDTNLLEKNVHRGIMDVAELRRRLGAMLRMDVIVLGTAFGDTPRHHLAMYMTPLHDGTVLVGDAAAGRGLVGEGFRPGERDDSGEPLVADFSQETVARFDFAAEELARAGYRVERIPTVPFDDKTYLSYTNGVFETRGSERIAYVPRYDIDALDRAAVLVYERLGWTVRPIRVRSVYRWHGTIGCLVNVIDRG